jgi:Tol biopolymer transport system component
MWVRVIIRGHEIHAQESSMRQDHTALPSLPLLAAGILCSLVLGACGQLDAGIERTATPDIQASATAAAVEAERAALATRVVELEPGTGDLGTGSDSEQIEAKLGQSTPTWETVWADIQVTYYPPEGSSDDLQRYHYQVWADQSEGKFKEIFGPSGGEPTYLRVADGESLLEMDLASGDARRSVLPAFEAPPEAPGEAVIMEPMRMALGPATGDMIFPAGLAQRGGAYQAAQMDEAAGRKALVVDWSRDAAGRVDRFWLDIHTGLVLRWQHFGKQGGQTMESEHLIKAIAYDVVFPPDLFTLTPKLAPRFSDPYGNPLSTSEAPAASEESPDGEGQVYFFTMDQGYPVPTVKLMRLPGSCIIGERSCPEPEIVPTPFKLQFSLTPLVWSPDGSVAALAYPIQKDGNWAGVHLFNPAADAWATLAEFPFIDPPLWSPDGEWIAFRVQDGRGGEAVYALRPEGTDLRDLSAAEGLPEDGGPYLLEGWLGHQALLRPQRSNAELAGGEVYTLDMDNGSVQALTSESLENSTLFPSPEGGLIAAVRYGRRSITLTLLDNQGDPIRELASFQNGGIYPVSWSPDGVWLAFGHEAEADQGARQDIYLAGGNAGGLKQVYSGSWVEAAVFSPEGDYLLIAGDSAIGEHLYVVSPSSMEQRLLQAPGLSLEESWLAPSWRPPVAP